ncbi:Nitrilase/cyanide hydratase and apolipoprotein N-acyltransferase [Akanthomyces lecanii RCEF 1005]|uniref:Nitrilase/cyanide hydratase and apolipoprotein N-acyltransferase n=1 Tax=Akanthomyces lecanii RCEF 1005 TaxID=1081108 RepID=A0A168I259_CORDF|nr:Nitrilase/cyanide hydratase and apolipoprotein N-acyltransferase [Akanthomyces lecanii RCEF 1005]
MASNTIRLGTASPGTQATKAATLEQLALLARRAASQRIDLLLLPEAYIGGYPRGTHFGSVIGERSHAGREEYARYFEAAVDLGDTTGEGGGGAGDAWVKRQLGGDDSEESRRGDGTREELERIAAETGVFLVVGLIERAGGTLYCAVVYVCPREGTLGKRRKVMPTGTERLCWGQGSPSTLRAVSTTIRGVRVNLAAAICWENYMPLLRQALYAQNVNLYLAPTADNRDAWLALMRTVAVEGRCFVVTSNMCQRDDSHGTTTATTNNMTSAAAAAPPPSRRRNSTITAEGNEIALPAASASSGSPSRRRRRSVFDVDGNEIVLCDSTTPEPAGPPTAAAVTPAVNGDMTPRKTAGVAPGWLSRGGSAIVSPYGDVLAGPQWEDSEGLVWEDVDFRECIKGRLDLDAAGSYSRNDSFKFSVSGLNLDPLPY